MAILDNVETPLNENNVSIWDNVKKWGLILALIRVVMTLVEHIFNVTAQGGLVIALDTVLAISLSLTLLYLSLREHRDQELGGFMSFKRAFFLAFIVGLVSSFILVIFNFAYLNYINPSAIEAQIETSKAMMEKFGMPEDKMDAALDKARRDIVSPFSILTGSLFYAFMFAIAGLIMGAITKKDRPMF